jgi:hypothetical protein
MMSMQDMIEEHKWKWYIPKSATPHCLVKNNIAIESLCLVPIAIVSHRSELFQSVPPPWFVSLKTGCHDACRHASEEHVAITRRTNI